MLSVWSPLGVSNRGKFLRWHHHCRHGHRVHHVVDLQPHEQLRRALVDEGGDEARHAGAPRVHGAAARGDGGAANRTGGERAHHPAAADEGATRPAASRRA